ncbi:hypothetical protein MUP32_03315 [Candidatus Microgenomates bacterium]|nr:hypothetical protein [Candidatus Microgenomates bacterium]
MKKVILILSFLFVLVSFSPSLFEIIHQKDIPPDRVFTLEHNYLFDFNFYVSRIREGLPAQAGQENRWQVTEKYYNQPHSGSLFQVVYLYLGKMGGVFGLDPVTIYHLSRIIFGFLLLWLIGKYVGNFFWPLVAFLLIVTSGSWPILVKAGLPAQAGNLPRFATYMGWWSAIDSLQRITFLPHVLIGQIFLLIFIIEFGHHRLLVSSRARNERGDPVGITVVSRDCFSLDKLGIAMTLFKHALKYGLLGFVSGIIFPPTIIIAYAFFGVMSVLEFISIKHSKLKKWFMENIVPRLVFFVFSLPSLIYMQLMFKVMPWSALPLFDIQHRMPLPYWEYARALGPVLPLGLAGMIIAILKKESKLKPVIAWVFSVVLLFLIFENVPQQSPLRFTEAMIHVPLGILAAYFFYWLWQLTHVIARSPDEIGTTWQSRAPACAGRNTRKQVARFLDFARNDNANLILMLSKIIRASVYFIITAIVLMGLGVMVSMVLWLTDQSVSKRTGTWKVPIGAQLVYPLKDFMDGIYFLRDKIPGESVVLGYVTGGNYIPAYTKHSVYIGHANTPNEDGKEKIAIKFFSGKMTETESREFLKKERISYIFFGPQEREVGGLTDLSSAYPFLRPVYKNNQLIIYSVASSRS